VKYDVIIVGSRCAGGALATLLARSGVKTLVLEADSLPSDMTMSTHYVHPPGMDVLDEIGVGDAVRKVAPPTKRGFYVVGTHRVLTDYPGGRAAYCVRRRTVDPLLQEAATKAGAELRDRHRVVELAMEDGRVTGVVAETPNGRETFRAKVVVGADGRNSTVAKLTGVEEYLVFPIARAGYWFYCPEPAIWRKDPRFSDHDLFIGWEGDGLRYVFQCDGDMLLLFAAPPIAEGRTWGKDYKAKTLEYLARSEIVRPLVDAAGARAEGWMGIVKADFYYRRPVGPGFALVGDAGSFKDWVTGHGMTDAYLCAKKLHRAILSDSPAAYERYWRERDVETLPLYFDAIRSGEVAFNDAFARLLFEQVAKRPDFAARLTAVADRTLSPFDAFSRGEILKVVAGGLVRGKFDAVRAFLALGKRLGQFGAELARRRALLDALAPRDAAEGTSRAPQPSAEAGAA
jgi:flavin-dependent dehydrogenase